MPPYHSGEKGVKRNAALSLKIIALSERSAGVMDFGQEKFWRLIVGLS
jgi:hypothetical protein